MSSKPTEDAPDAPNRRTYRRIPASELAQARIRIPNRPPISLVDLSSSGALLEMPFQLPPEARVTLELSTPAEQLSVPFHLLRCYVADLRGGLRYHAAGVFDRILKLPASLGGEATPASSDRLIAVLEGFLHTNQATDPRARGASFNELLKQVVADLRQGESADLVSTRIRAQLAGLFPSLAIGPASPSELREAATSARFFGLDFRSSSVLTAADRRFLRASAQLITLVDRNSEHPTEYTGSDRHRDEWQSVIHSAAEWQALLKDHSYGEADPARDAWPNP